MISICKLTHDQIKKLSKEMVILIDTREKVNDHILNYFNKKNIAYRQQALEFGDYSFMLPKVDESISKMITNANVENVYRIIRNRNKLRFTQK